MKTCGFSGCDRALSCRGLCHAHYCQRRRGSELKPLRPRGPNEIRVTGDVAEIVLVDNANRPRGVAVIDAEDAPVASEYRWCMNSKEHTSYVVGHRLGESRGTRILLHRLLMSPPGLMEIDHVNGDGLDNRRVNLRVVTARENRQNQPIRRDNTSGFRGVYFSKSLGKWIAHLRDDRRNHRVGAFDTKAEAAQAAEKERDCRFSNHVTRPKR